MNELTDEHWRLTKDGFLSVEWSGRPDRDSLPELAKRGCFMLRDYDSAKSGPVEWYCSGNWKFEQIIPERATNQNGER